MSVSDRFASEVDRPSWLKRLGGILRPHLGWVIAGFGAAVLAQLTNVVNPLFQRQVIDQVIVLHRGSLTPWLVLLLATGITRFFLSLVFRYAGGALSLKVQYDLRTAIFSHLQRLDFARHDQLQTGQVVGRAITDLNAVQQMLGFLPNMLSQVIFFFAALGIMVWLSPPLALVALVAAPLMLWVAIKLRDVIHPATWDSSQKAAVVAGVVEQSVTGVRIVKGFGQERGELGRLAEAARSLYASRVRALRLRAQYASTLQALPSLAQVGVLAAGGWLAIHHQLTLGTFLVTASYVTQLQTPTRLLANMFVVAQMGRASIERIFDLLDSTPTVKEQSQAVVLPKPEGVIEFDHVSFGYMRSDPVLHDFTLTVQPGETVALVGTPGSGKSTVAMLLPRFYDVQNGAIRIGGTDIREVTLASLRGSIGVVFEDSFLFSDTVRANIAYGKPHATMEEIVAAAKAAEADEFIRAMPEGYETVVGEQGLTLSGGQRQRVAVARALITAPQILLLDDATSAVDTRIEREIQETLRRLLRGRTTILVARRRSTLNLADRICVVDAGRIVAEGTHEYLMATSSVYRELLAGPDDLPAAPTAGGFTPELWLRDGQVVGLEQAIRTAGRLQVTAHGIAGPGGGGGHGSGAPGWMSDLAPTPELLAKLDRLPRARDKPDVTVDQAAADDGRPWSFVRFLRRWRWQLLLGGVLVTFDAAAQISGPALIRLGIDAGVVRDTFNVVLFAAAAFLVIALLDWMDNIAQLFITGRTSERILYALRVRIFAHLQRLGLAFYDQEMGGRIMTRMTSDVEALTNLMQTGLVTALTSLLTSGGVAVVMLVLEPRLGLATLTVAVPLAIGGGIFRHYSRRAYADARERIAIVNADLQERVSGVRVTQAFGRERRNDERFESLSAAFMRARLRTQAAISIFFPFIQLMSDLATVIVLFVGANLIAQHSLTVGVLIAFLLYLGIFFTPIQQLSMVLDSYQQAAVALSRISELLRTPTDVPETAKPVDVVGRLSGEIQFNDVQFQYPNSRDPALKGINLRIASRETIAFVGETGAGKTTLVKLVARYYDATSGAVLVDGVDVRRYDLAAYRHRLGVVPQEPFLFAGTIRDNIAYGRPEATDREVEAAARAVGAHSLIASLPGGYLHLVGERGRTLSFGQRQLLALARALLVDPDILLLDEATSNLDLATEARVTAAMGVAARGRTTLLIAHRLSTAARADRIVVMDQGRIAEIGTHSELLARGGIFARLWMTYEHSRTSAAV